MQTRSKLGLGVSVVLLSIGCGGGGPTGSSNLLPPESHAAPLSAYSLADPNGLAANGEDFSCADVDQVRARFGPPGFVQADNVGLYVFFSGVPEGPKRLRIWWDYEHDGATFQDHRFAEEETVIENVYEHHYQGLSGPTEFLVRVELIRDGLTGNCARNRSVVVGPANVSSGPAGPAPPTTQTANVGPPVTAVTGTGFGTEGVRFTALTTFTIDRVQVDVRTAGGLTVELLDANTFAVVSTTSVAVGVGVQQIPLGFNVPPGDYILCKAGTATLGATFGGITYPITLAGVVSLTDTSFFSGFFGFYYYFYDWQVTW